MIALPPLVDLRHEQEPAHKKTRVRNGKTVARDPSTVTGIVVHQTAVEYGITDKQLRASGGNRQLALARRGLNVACHAIAFRDGFFAAVRPLRHFVLHGNAFNAYTLGLEIDGHYPGLRDDPATMPRREDIETTQGGDPDAVTVTIVDAARAALKWLVEEGRREGMPIVDIYAHRQSSGTRRSDPGQELWEKVIEDYAIPTLGLKAHYELALDSKSSGKGRPIPVQWSKKNGVGRY